MTLQPQCATLYVVGMPIGDMTDITLRALSVMRCAQLILAEHPDHTRKILAGHDIHTAIERYLPDNTSQYLELLKAGSNIALVSDAGMPCIADPGTALVNAAWENGLSVDTAPGTTALTAALAISGLFAQRFQFFGFPPRKSTDRSEFFKEIAEYNGTVVIYETRRGLRSTMKDLHQRLAPHRKFLVAGGITTRRAILVRSTLATIESDDQPDYRGHTGPFTLVIERSYY